MSLVENRASLTSLDTAVPRGTILEFFPVT
jgi:hypothetical protein